MLPARSSHRLGGIRSYSSSGSICTQHIVPLFGRPMRAPLAHCEAQPGISRPTWWVIAYWYAVENAATCICPVTSPSLRHRLKQFVPPASPFFCRSALGGGGCNGSGGSKRPPAGQGPPDDESTTGGRKQPGTSTFGAKLSAYLVPWLMGWIPNALCVLLGIPVLWLGLGRPLAQGLGRPLDRAAAAIEGLPSEAARWRREGKRAAVSTGLKPGWGVVMIGAWVVLKIGSVPLVVAGAAAACAYTWWPWRVAQPVADADEPPTSAAAGS